MLATMELVRTTRWTGPGRLGALEHSERAFTACLDEDLLVRLRGRGFGAKAGNRRRGVHDVLCPLDGFVIRARGAHVRHDGPGELRGAGVEGFDRRGGEDAGDLGGGAHGAADVIACFEGFDEDPVS